VMVAAGGLVNYPQGGGGSAIYICQDGSYKCVRRIKRFSGARAANLWCDFENI